MIDWLYACLLVATTPVWCFGWVLSGVIIGSFGAPGFVVRAIYSLVLFTILAIPWILVVNFMGYVFDPANDSLTYPVYLFRRTIQISQIRDANAETTTTRRSYNSNSYARLAGDFGSKRPVQTAVYRSHVVNISGDFGVRQMRFGARYKRDQFLSILRVAAPQCRITRGYWS
jgi:hypothetical protein